jgi:hypothetical protein
MISDADLAGLAALAYTAPPTWWQGDVHACWTRVPGATVVAFRGTVPDDMADWLRDIDAWPDFVPGLGYCHAGFADGVKAIWGGLSVGLRDEPRVVLTGHSLGGALAIIAAGMLAVSGSPPAALVTFGAPRAGLEKLADALRAVPVRQYRNGHDPVPEVPSFFQHVRRLCSVGTPALDPLLDHEIACYQVAVAAMERKVAAGLGVMPVLGQVPA